MIRLKSVSKESVKREEHHLKSNRRRYVRSNQYIQLLCVYKKRAIYFMFFLKINLMGLEILVADDNEEINSAYIKILGKRGHNVLCTENGLQCFKVYKETLENLKRNQLKHNPFDLILTDYAMPKVDGVNLVKAILKLMPTQRIIFSTAYPDDACYASFKKQVEIELLKKPFDLDTLIEAVERKNTQNVSKSIEKEIIETIENSKKSVYSWVYS